MKILSFTKSWELDRGWLSDCMDITFHKYEYCVSGVFNSIPI